VALGCESKAERVIWSPQKENSAAQKSDWERKNLAARESKRTPGAGEDEQISRQKIKLRQHCGWDQEPNSRPDRVLEH
jgi:hypothetical protein